MKTVVKTFFTFTSAIWLALAAAEANIESTIPPTSAIPPSAGIPPDIPSSDSAVDPRNLVEFLKSFHQDTKLVMNSPIVKRDEDGRIVTQSSSPFEIDQASLDEMLLARRIVRDDICAASETSCVDAPIAKPKWAAINEANQVTAFLSESSFIRKMSEMHEKRLLESALFEVPWSDSYWPTQKGMIARRWLDSGFPNSSNWLINYNYYQSVPPWMVETDRLSPAEKYDRLVGDHTYGLTRRMWDSGRVSYETYGRVASWTGLCHGWAPAAFMAPNPKRSVHVRAANGETIRFYPSDLKALASLAWGEAAPRLKFVGKRCNVPNPKEDSVGRVMDENCFDVNPGTWHIGVVNQIGVQHRGFVFDSTYDYQVWNYPVYAYRYTYFNPQTLATTQSLSSAMVPMSKYTIDKFKSYRSPNAAYAVGVSMDVWYTVPTVPSRSPVTKASLNSVRYVYDLELDKEGNVIGGEWYSNFHPDFIWTPEPGGRTRAVGEKDLDQDLSWDAGDILPRILQEAASTSSAVGQPLGVVVDGLLKIAK